MEINFSEELQNEEIGDRVRAILGVPEVFLDDNTITSPDFLLRANRYINKKISKYLPKEIEEEPEVPEEPEEEEKTEENEEVGIPEEKIEGLSEEDNTEEDNTEEEPIEPIEPEPIEPEPEEFDLNIDLLKIAYLYYLSYLLCSGMYARLPKQMENVSTKTIINSIDWDKKALELLEQCDAIIDDVLEELGEEPDYGISFAVLSNSSEYPNNNI